MAALASSAQLAYTDHVGHDGLPSPAPTYIGHVWHAGTLVSCSHLYRSHFRVVRCHHTLRYFLLRRTIWTLCAQRLGLYALGEGAWYSSFNVYFQYDHIGVHLSFSCSQVTLYGTRFCGTVQCALHVRDDLGLCIMGVSASAQSSTSISVRPHLCTLIDAISLWSFVPTIRWAWFVFRVWSLESVRFTSNSGPRATISLHLPCGSICTSFWIKSMYIRLWVRLVLFWYFVPWYFMALCAITKPDVLISHRKDPLVYLVSYVG